MSTRENESTDPIQQYVDGEIVGDELHAFEERLQNEPELRARVDAEREFVGALGGALAPSPLPSGYEAKIRTLIGAHWPDDASEGGGQESSTQAKPSEHRDGAAPRRVERPATGPAANRPAANRPAANRPAANRPAAKRPAAERRRPAAERRQDGPRRTAAKSAPPKRWPRHPLTRVAAIAATLLIVASAVSLLRDDSPESGLPWIIRDSIDLFERALGSPAHAAPPEHRPILRKCEALRLYCEGKRRDGKLNPCIIFQGPDGTKIGYFCLDDRVEDAAFFESEPYLEARGYTVVRCGPPGALHIWVAKGLTPESIAGLIEPGDPADADGGPDAELHVESMLCPGCAHHIAQMLRKIEGVTDVRCNVEQRTARVWFEAPSTREALVAALIEVGHEAR